MTFEQTITYLTQLCEDFRNNGELFEFTEMDAEVIEKLLYVVANGQEIKDAKHNIAEDVMKCAKWHRENHHSRQTVVDCLFYGLYESKYGKSIPLAEMWNDNKDIDVELSQWAEEIANSLYE